MKSLLRLAYFLWLEERTAMHRGLLLSVAVLVAGIGLLGLSGWFIVAASAAGIAGTGSTFDVFRPSAGVRFLALGRTAARYGERLLTHDATLRALARLRIQVLRHLARVEYGDMVRLRGGELLNRLTSDIDALDSLSIRFVFPVLSGGLTIGIAFVGLWYLVDLTVAIFVVLTVGLSSWCILIWLGAKAHQHSREAERSLRSLRAGTIDHLRGRDVLAFANALDRSLMELARRESSARSAQTRVARLDVAAGAAIGLASSFVSAGALLIGSLLAIHDVVDPALAALAFFATLAIFEAVAPLRRGVAELGRMWDAAGRIATYLAPIEERPHQASPGQQADTINLEIDQLQVAVGERLLLSEPLSLSVSGGEVLALTGRSGVGKSTVMNTVAGLVPPVGGNILVDHDPISIMSEYEVRSAIGYLPQRSALLSGTIRDGVTLGTPANDEQIAEVLDAVALTETVAGKGGLDASLGEGGSGLSGGQHKRLALARVLLRKPRLLLLDEVTEGLEDAMAYAVLRGVRSYLPEISDCFLVPPQDRN